LRRSSILNPLSAIAYSSLLGILQASRTERITKRLVCDGYLGKQGVGLPIFLILWGLISSSLSPEHRICEFISAELPGSEERSELQPNSIINSSTRERMMADDDVSTRVSNNLVPDNRCKPFPIFLVERFLPAYVLYGYYLFLSSY
jgi:hypothetical protein